MNHIDRQCYAVGVSSKSLEYFSYYSNQPDDLAPRFRWGEWNKWIAVTATIVAAFFIGAL